MLYNICSTHRRQHTKSESAAVLVPEEPEVVFGLTCLFWDWIQSSDWRWWWTTANHYYPSHVKSPAQLVWHQPPLRWVHFHSCSQYVPPQAPPVMSTIPAPPPMPPAPSPIAEHKITGQVSNISFRSFYNVTLYLTFWWQGGAKTAASHLAWGDPKQCNLQQAEAQAALG